MYVYIKLRLQSIYILKMLIVNLFFQLAHRNIIVSSHNQSKCREPGHFYELKPMAVRVPTVQRKLRQMIAHLEI